MIAPAKIAAVVRDDVLRFVVLLFCSARSLVGEHLFLRQQLALYKERCTKP